MLAQSTLEQSVFTDNFNNVCCVFDRWGHPANISFTPSRIDIVWELTLTTGKTYAVTPDHTFLLSEGYFTQLLYLREGDSLQASVLNANLYPVYVDTVCILNRMEQFYTATSTATGFCLDAIISGIS